MHKKFLDSLTQRFEFVAMLKRVQKVSVLLKKGAQTDLPCPLGGGGRNLKVIIAPYCKPPLHVIKYQSLIPLFDVL